MPKGNLNQDVGVDSMTTYLEEKEPTIKLMKYSVTNVSKVDSRRPLSSGCSENYEVARTDLTLLTENYYSTEPNYR